ncbi:glucose-6-phosphate dehydrogenase [Reticulibacter mediterranei]|uniref:Glucose-6-phosphate dehydrogenase n=1 Tax=Reticulibacter mediterranei TaxID=2778369 RepID=A0A8J3N4K0_9CHLR|nr:glucose-6-phosphate dehydrogenase assembly protein OpcA [Reticulibacter mediterranei]GHO95558.1 glucose-6-phosphate dehydrogenase [Reticulibacter mediterranei]
MTKEIAETPGVRLPWAGKMVRMEEVEETLSYFWRMSADNVRISQNMNVRTSVLNFVICAQDIPSAQRASALLRNLSSTHIARVILLILNTSAESPTDVTTWATLRSFPIISDIMRHSFEQVTILASGAATRASASLIQPLLKPDLPVYLWWLGDPPQDETILHKLTDLSSRVIVDSNTFLTPEQSVSSLSTFLQEAPDSALSDLNWGRITPWRQLVAQFFDVPAYKPYLAGVYNIEVEHAVAPLARHLANEQGDISPNPTRALLLAGWLKNSLNWKVNGSEENLHDPETGTHIWNIVRNTGPLHIDLATKETTTKLGHSGRGSIQIRPRVQSGIQPGSLCLVRLSSTIDNKRATFTINREDETDNVLTSAHLPEEGGTLPQRTVNVATPQDASVLLHDELEIIGRDHLYEAALHEVFEMLAE